MNHHFRRTDCLSRTRLERRRGAVLVQFALLTFGILALAALVIDLGFVRQARLQMQSAADSAAMDGLRFRDDPPPGIAPGTEDQSRREAASRIAQLIFDHDLDPASADPANCGAGPLVDFSDGIALAGTTYRASELIAIPATPVYDPVLRSNLANDPAGDMVSGSWLGGDDHTEGNDYSRADFTAGGNDAFLVRLRRTAESFDPVSDASSGGPPIPLLFGRGSLMNFDARAAGVPVRATAIAAARRANSIGRPSPADSLPGSTPFVLRRTAWETLLVADVPAEISFSLGSPDVSIGGASAGFVVSLLPADPEPVTEPVLGQAAFAAPATLDRINQLPTAGAAYVLIVADAGPIANRVIGFGFVSVTRDPAEPTTATLTKRTNRIAAFNATPAIVEPLPEVFSDTTDDPDLAILFAEHDAFAAPLLAAALVR